MNDKPVAEVLSHSAWRDDPRFAPNSARMANRDALVVAMNVLREFDFTDAEIDAFISMGVVESIEAAT